MVQTKALQGHVKSRLKLSGHDHSWRDKKDKPKSWIYGDQQKQWLDDLNEWSGLALLQQWRFHGAMLPRIWAC